MKLTVIYAAAVCLAPTMLIAQIQIPEPPLSAVLIGGASLIAFVAWRRRAT